MELMLAFLTEESKQAAASTAVSTAAGRLRPGRVQSLGRRSVLKGFGLTVSCPVDYWSSECQLVSLQASVDKSPSCQYPEVIKTNTQADL